MSEHLRAGEQAIADDILSNGSEIVFVSPDGTETEATANIGQSEHEEGTIGGATASLTIVKSHDFIVRTAAIPAGFDQQSARGWTIQFNGGVYRPATFNEEPPVVDSGRFGIMKRIHTKQSGETDA
jgi:hypothetical protein